MPSDSVKGIALSVLLAGAVGAGTAFTMVRGMGPPGGPAIEHRSATNPGLDLEKENADLRERIRSLTAEFADAKLNLAATRAMPRLNPAIAAGAALTDPEPGMLAGLSEGEKEKFLALLREMRRRSAAQSAEAQVAFEEAELRNRFRRSPPTSALGEAKLEEVIRILKAGAEKVQLLYESGGAGLDEAGMKARVAVIGQETRRGLDAILSPEELRAVNDVLAPVLAGEVPPPAGGGSPR